MNVCDLWRTMAIAGTARGGGRSIPSRSALIQARGRRPAARDKAIVLDGRACFLRPYLNQTLAEALARAFRWRKMLETGRYATFDDFARAEKINAFYVSRVLRLTLLAPHIVEAILEGRQPEGTTLPGLTKGFPAEWQHQPE